MGFERYEYGGEVQSERDYESLTQKQRNVVDAVLEANVDASNAEVSEGKNFTPSYVTYVKDNFRHIIDDRRAVTGVATDGGEPIINLEISESDAWSVIQLVGDELSQKVYRQTRRQGGDLINLRLPESEVWQAIQLVGDELSQDIYRQARRQ